MHEQILVVEETKFCGALVTMTVGYFVWDLYNVGIQEQFDTMMTLHLHHIYRCMANSAILWFGTFLLLYPGNTELSSPLMHLRWYFRNIYGKEFRWLVTTVAFVLLFLTIGSNGRYALRAVGIVLLELLATFQSLPPWLFYRHPRCIYHLC